MGMNNRHAAPAIKPLFRALLVIALSLFTGCDPGMRIRQVDSPTDASKSACITPAGMAVTVETRNEFIGSELYVPKITVTNSSTSPITITGIELVAHGVTYENKPSWKEPNFPLAVPVQTTKSFGGMFRFSEGVNHIFSKPAELRIHYSSQGHDGVACTNVAGE